MNDQYKNPRWQKKRLHVLERDNWTCRACGDAESTLHVHHRAYHGSPWETPDEMLQTLCESCHEKLGEHPKGGVWWELCGDLLSVVVTWCPKCGSQEFKDKGGHAKCISCGWSSGLYDAVTFTGGVVFRETSKQKPKQYSLRWLSGIITKVRSGGASEVEIFNAVFPDYPTGFFVEEMFTEKQRLREILTRHDSTLDDEIHLLKAFAVCRRAVVRCLDGSLGDGLGVMEATDGR